MKRVIIYGSLLLILGTFAAVWSAGSWLLESPDGVRWLFREISRRTALKVGARSVSGGLGSTLRVEGLILRWPEGEAAAEELRLRCRPLWLSFGHLAIQELTLRGVRIRDDRPASGRPPELVWPRLSGAPAWLNGWVDLLTVAGMEYRRSGEAPLRITRGAATLHWRHAVLTATALELAAPAGRLSGRVTAGFGPPSLSALLTALPATPRSGLSRIDLQTRLCPGRLPGELAGPLSLTAFTGTRRALDLTGELGVLPAAVTLRGMTLTRPGQRGTIRGEGTLLVRAPEPELRLELRAARLDLAAESGTATDLSGTVNAEGTASRFTGRLDLANGGGGWRTARLAGAFSGDRTGMTVTGLEGTLLGGRVRGGLRISWGEGLAVAGALRGDGLDPARVTPDWPGTVNLDLQGSARWRDRTPLRAELSGRLRESRLRGLPLKGEIAAAAADGAVRIDRLFLEGNGFRISAGGDLQQRLDVAATVTDLSGLIPRTRGSLDLAGWVRHAAGRTSGVLSGRGRQLAGDGAGIAAAELTARLGPEPGSPVSLAATLEGVTWDHLRADEASLTIDGTRERHTLAVAFRSAGAEIRGGATGSYGREGWDGTVTTLSGRDRIGPWNLTAPARLALSPARLALSPARLTGAGPERLELAGRLSFAPWHGSLGARWRDLDLGRSGPWLSDLKLAGRSSGTLTLESPAGDRLTLAAHATAAGIITAADRTVTVRQAALDLEADGSGIRSFLDIGTAEGIRVRGRFASSLPARPGVPEQGEFDATWEGVDLALLRGQLPPEVDLRGRFSGKVVGRLLPGERFDLTGSALLAGAAARWRGEGREISLRAEQSNLSWEWRGESLRGTASFLLTGHGEVEGSFALPLPARLGTAPEPQGALRMSLTGRLHEQGLLTALFPGLVRESRGEIRVDLRADGPWQGPRLAGRLELTGAGAFLPSAGVTLQGVELAARLEHGRVTVERFTAGSGGGTLQGNATLDLAGYRLTGYRGRVRGERFQAVRLPELQLLASPELTFEGTPERLVLRGNVRIPELHATGSDRTTAVMPSSDVVVEGGGGETARLPGPALDLRVLVELGERVFVKAAGFDGRLEGAVTLASRNSEPFTGTGEIRVARGRYSAYGVNLDIRRGRALFAGGPVARPTLDILALREIGDVTAGVAVRGTPAAPVVRLYAEPPLPDAEILSYIVLGRKLTDSEEKGDLLVKAASLLTAAGDSLSLQEQLKSRLGIDTLEFSPDRQSSGYRRVEPALLTPSQKSAANTVSESMLQVGKYLTPDLYLSYGWSLFTGSHLVRIRYNLTKQWEIESRTGTADVGGDIFYRIEFD